MFTTGATQDTVLLSPGTGETLQLEGTIDVIDGPNGNNANILINGTPLGGVISLDQLSDVNFVNPLTAGDFFVYNGTYWYNTVNVNAPDVSTNYISTTSIVGPDFSLGTNNNLGVTTISRLQCDNIRTGLLDCLLRANNAERLVPAYTGINLNLTGEFLDLNPIIESTTIGPDCVYAGNIIASTYGGTGHANIYNFINACTADMYFDQQVYFGADVQFGKVNDLDILTYSPSQGNAILLGESAGGSSYNPNNVTDIVCLGHNSCAESLVTGSDIVCIGNETGQYTNGSNITILGSSVGINPCSGNNIILIGNDANTNVPTLFTNNYFCLRGAGTSPTVTPIIESTGLDGIKATTMYGNLAGNFTNLGYNGYNISFFTTMKFNQCLATTNNVDFANVNGVYLKGYSTPSNVNIGYQASKSITSGGYQVTLGDHTLEDVTTQSYNTAIGAYAGRNITGNYLTLLGSFVGSNTNVGDNVILIGNDIYCKTPNNTTSNYFRLQGAGVSAPYIFQSTNIDNSSIMATTIGGSLIANLSGMKYNNYDISFTTTMAFNQPLATTSTITFKGGSFGQVNNPCTVTIKSGDYTVYNQPSYLFFQCGYGDSPYDQNTFIKATNAQSNGIGSSQQELSFGKTSNSAEIIHQKINYQGQITTPLQSQFCAYLTADANDVTGDGTTYKVAFNATKTNINSNFNTGTYTYTTPVAGVYTFSTSIKLSGITSSHTNGFAEIITGSPSASRIAECNPYAMYSSGSALILNGSTGPIYLNSGVGVYVSLQISNGTKVVDVKTDGSTYLTCFFSGTLLG